METGKRPKTGGRKKGTPNKVTADVKAMVLEAFAAVGGAKYLAERAIDQPVAFMSLLGRVLPLTVAGDPENPLRIQKVEREIVRPTD